MCHDQGFDVWSCRRNLKLAFTNAYAQSLLQPGGFILKATLTKCITGPPTQTRQYHLICLDENFSLTTTYFNFT